MVANRELGILLAKLREATAAAAAEAARIASLAAWRAMKEVAMTEVAFALVFSGKKQLYKELLTLFQRIHHANTISDASAHMSMPEWKQRYESSSKQCPSCTLHQVAKTYYTMREMDWVGHLKWMKECVCCTNVANLAPISGLRRRYPAYTMGEWYRMYARIDVVDYFTIVLPALIKSRVTLSTNTTSSDVNGVGIDGTSSDGIEGGVETGGRVITSALNIGVGDGGEGRRRQWEIGAVGGRWESIQRVVEGSSGSGNGGGRREGRLEGGASIGTDPTTPTASPKRGWTKVPRSVHNRGTGGGSMHDTVWQ
jgi:hypothetical protein